MPGAELQARRAELVRLLQSVRQQRAEMEAAARGLRQKKWRQRRRALRRVSSLPEIWSRPLIASCCNDRSRHMRIAAAALLEKLPAAGPGAGESLSALHRMCHAIHHEERLAAVRALGSVGDRSSILLLTELIPSSADMYSDGVRPRGVALFMLFLLVNSVSPWRLPVVMMILGCCVILFVAWLQPRVLRGELLAACADSLAAIGRRLPCGEAHASARILTRISRNLVQTHPTARAAARRAAAALTEATAHVANLPLPHQGLSDAGALLPRPHLETDRAAAPPKKRKLRNSV